MHLAREQRDFSHEKSGRRLSITSGTRPGSRARLRSSRDSPVETCRVVRRAEIEGEKKRTKTKARTAARVYVRTGVERNVIEASLSKSVSAASRFPNDRPVCFYWLDGCFYDAPFYVPFPWPGCPYLALHLIISVGVIF